MSATFGERSPNRRESRRERVVKQQSEGNNSLLAYATFQVNVGAGISDESLRMMRASSDNLTYRAEAGNEYEAAAKKERSPFAPDSPDAGSFQKQDITKEPESKPSPEMKQPKQEEPAKYADRGVNYHGETWDQWVDGWIDRENVDPDYKSVVGPDKAEFAYYAATDSGESAWKSLYAGMKMFASPDDFEAYNFAENYAANEFIDGREPSNLDFRKAYQQWQDKRNGVSQPQAKEPENQPQQVEPQSQPSEPQQQKPSVSDKPTEPPAQPPEPFVSTVKPDVGQKFKDQGPVTIPTGTFGADPNDTRQPETLPPGRDQKPPKPTSGPGMDIGDARRNLQQQFQQNQMAKAKAMMGNWYPEQGFGWGEGPLNADNGGVMGEGVTNFARESTTNHELTSATLAVLAARVRLATRALRDASS